MSRFDYSTMGHKYYEYLIYVDLYVVNPSIPCSLLYYLNKFVQ
jgi:hypothetical protein